MSVSHLLQGEINLLMHIGSGPFGLYFVAELVLVNV
jgi:hypothetical protein